MVDFPHYDLKFIQREPCRDKSSHLWTLIYKFFCEDSKVHYIVRAEYHEENVFAIKFYCKQHRKSKYKYNKLMNVHNYSGLMKILNTCILVVIKILEQFPSANLALSSARSIDFSHRVKLVEDLPENQRYRVYTELIKKRIGNKTFTHYKFPKYSSYLLVNNKAKDISKKKDLIKKMFVETYNELPDV